MEADRANREFDRANQEAKKARSEKAAAEAERLRAEWNLTLAMDAPNELYLEAIGRDRLLGDRDRDESRRELSGTEKELIEAGLDFYKKIAGQNEASTAATFETARAFLQIGMLRANLDDHEAADAALLEAIARLKNLTESFPENANYFKLLAHRHRAKLLSAMGRPEAVDDYTWLIEHQPKQPEHLLSRGMVRRAAGDNSGADADFDAYLLTHTHAIEKDESDWRAWNRRGLALMKMERWEAALADFDRAAKLHRTSRSCKGTGRPPSFGSPAGPTPWTHSPDWSI